MSGQEAPLKAGDRVGALYEAGGSGTTFGPAVVESVGRMDTRWFAVLRMVHGYEQSLVIDDFITKEEALDELHRSAWTVFWHKLSAPGWKPPDRQRSPEYLQEVEGMRRTLEPFHAYPGKVENWTTCGLFRMGRGTVFADPDDHSKHLVLISKEHPPKRHFNEVVPLTVLARNAVNGSVELLRTRSNASALTRCDIYYLDRGGERE